MKHLWLNVQADIVESLRAPLVHGLFRSVWRPGASSALAC